jgi:hypothetical protein
LEYTNKHTAFDNNNNIIIMSDDLCEEQEMEAEALAAIFDDCLEIISSTQPFEWAVDLYPEQLAADEEDEDAPQNHVGVRVVAKIPLTYPEESLPEFNIKVLKGLTEEHEQELIELANEEAENNRGMPVMYAVCERLREWLLENNEKGMDDRSMYTQMLKREKDKERDEVRNSLFLDVFVFGGIPIGWISIQNNMYLRKRGVWRVSELFPCRGC